MVLKPDEPTPEGYSDVTERLRAEGIRARFTCLMVPVQLEGHLPSGESFYFRCRYSTCSLGIASVDGTRSANQPGFRKSPGGRGLMPAFSMPRRRRRCSASCLPPTL